MSGTGNFLDLIAHPTVVDPTKAFLQAGQAANAIWDARKSQAEQLQGQAAIDAIQSTGQMDQARYGAAMRGYGPGAALGAQESMQKAQTLSTNQLNFNDAQQTQLAKHFGGMITQPDALQTPDGYRTALLEARSDGTLDDNHLKGAMAALDALGPNPTPTQLRTLGSRFLITGLSSADIARNALPQTVISHTAQGDIPTVVAPAPVGLPPTGGQYQAPGGTQQGVAPGARTETIDNNIYLPDGKTPNPNYGQRITVPTPVQTPPTMPAPTPLPSQRRVPSPTNQPRLNQPSPAGNQAAPPPVGNQPPAVQPQTPVGNQPPGALPASLPPGAATPIEASNTAWVAAQAAKANYTQRTFPLAQAIGLEPGVTTGPKAELFNTVKGSLVTVAHELGVAPEAIQRLTPSVADFEKLNKYLTDYVAKLPQAGGTDARLASAVSGNPSVHITNLALGDVAKSALALERFNQAAAIDFEDNGAPNGQFLTHQGGWQRQMDPRAFLPPMDPARTMKMLNGMSGPERATFQNTLAWIKAHPDILSSPTMPGH